MYINMITLAQEAINQKVAVYVWLGRVFLAGCLASCILTAIAFFYYRIPEVIEKLWGRRVGKKNRKIQGRFLQRKNMSREGVKPKKSPQQSILRQKKKVKEEKTERRIF